MSVVQKLLSECQSHRDCQLPVHHLLFGPDPCPGTAKYLHVDYKCKPSESCKQLRPSCVPTCRFPAIRLPISPNPGALRLSCASPRPAEHKRHMVCEGGELILRCKPPRVLIIYAAVYGRGLGQPDTCPSHLTRPPPFGEWSGRLALSGLSE